MWEIAHIAPRAWQGEGAHTLWQVSKQNSCQNNLTSALLSHLARPEAVPLLMQLKWEWKFKTCRSFGVRVKLSSLQPYSSRSLEKLWPFQQRLLGNRTSIFIGTKNGSEPCLNYLWFHFHCSLLTVLCCWAIHPPGAVLSLAFISSLTLVPLTIANIVMMEEVLIMLQQTCKQNMTSSPSLLSKIELHTSD